MPGWEKIFDDRVRMVDEAARVDLRGHFDADWVTSVAGALLGRTG